MGTEVALPLRFDHTVSYTDVEAALVNVGFTDYIIIRSNNQDGTCDVQLIIRPEEGELSLHAGDTLSALTDAVAALESEPA